MNPFREKTKPLKDGLVSFRKMFVAPYNKTTVEQNTKLCYLLMQAIENESINFLHNFLLCCKDENLKRDISLVCRVEQLEQKRLSSIKPLGEIILETLLLYLQLDIEFSATIAQKEQNTKLKEILDFFIVENVDHLYRLANVLEYEFDISPERILNKRTEVMPARPTLAQVRFPFDDIRNNNENELPLLTRIHLIAVIAIKKQIQNIMIYAGNFVSSENGCKLINEIGLVYEEHLNTLLSMKQINFDMEEWLLHEYVECYFYYSCLRHETVPYIKDLYSRHFEFEVSHLQFVYQLLKKKGNDYSNKNFPDLFQLKFNREYIRRLLWKIKNTLKEGKIVEVDSLHNEDRYFWFQEKLAKRTKYVPSHYIIAKYIKKFGKDYRYMVREHPIKDLMNRSSDNTSLGREKKPY